LTTVHSFFLFQVILLKSSIYQRWAHATFFESAIAIPQLEGSTSAIAIPQLLKKCYSATTTPQFHNRNIFWSPQLESFTSTIFGAFLAVKSSRFMKKIIRGKKISCYCPFMASFCFPEKQTVLKIFLVDF
jgi:hypothetical protein